jgi:hypothetical protein
MKSTGLNNLLKFMFFGAGVLGPPAWKPGPKILGRFAGAPKTAHPATVLGPPVEML